METELKFQVPAERSAALRRAVATATARKTRLQAVYADTADHRLAAAGLALRLRKEGRVWVQTLKGRGDGLMQRLEHEVPLPPQAGVPALDRARHQGTAAGAALDAALGEGTELQPLYRTDIQRLHRRVRHQGALIEIAYDCGRIFAAGHSLPVDEIEFELISGPAAALPDLAARWVARHGLWWDVRTKSERGFRLALGLDKVPAVKAGAVTLGEAASPGQAWSAMVQSALAHALPNAAEMAGGAAAPEHLHQLRVALRRLRTVLRLCAQWSGDAPAALALEARWRAAFGQLGAARGADVLAGTLLPRLLAAGAPLQPRPPDSAVQQAAAQMVRAPAFSELLLQTLALGLPRPALPQDAPAVPAARLLPEAARQVLKRAWRSAWDDAASFGAAPPAMRHRARKRLKRLRYMLEFLQPLLPRKPARRFLKAMGAALDELGHCNDLQVAEAHFRAQHPADAVAWFALGWIAAQREPALQRALRSLRQLEKLPRPWRSR